MAACYIALLLFIATNFLFSKEPNYWAKARNCNFLLNEKLLSYQTICISIYLSKYRNGLITGELKAPGN